MSRWEYLQLYRTDDELSLSPLPDGYEAMLDTYHSESLRAIENPNVAYETRRAEGRRITRRHHEIFTELLNALGRDGWEMVLMHARSGGPGVGWSRDFYFKRPLPD